MSKGKIGYLGFHTCASTPSRLTTQTECSWWGIQQHSLQSAPTDSPGLAEIQKDKQGLKMVRFSISTADAYPRNHSAKPPTPNALFGAVWFPSVVEKTWQEWEDTSSPGVSLHSLGGKWIVTLHISKGIIKSYGLSSHGGAAEMQPAGARGVWCTTVLGGLNGTEAGTCLLAHAQLHHLPVAAGAVQEPGSGAFAADSILT